MQANSHARRRVLLLATGGTIAGAGATGAGTGSAAYHSAVLSVQELVAQVPGLDALADLRAEQLFQVDSADFTDALLLQLARRVAQACRQPDVDGVVVLHGTDTLQESAFFLHLVLPSDKPVVLTGAMRASTALSADGPANLADAVALAAHPGSTGRGVLATLDGQIFSGRDLAKTRAHGVAAFSSPHGALGWMADGVPRWFRRSTRPHTVHSEFSIETIDDLPLVGVVTSHGNMRAEIFDAWVSAGARAIVFAAYGGGTVPAYLLPRLVELSRQGVLLVRASRTGDGFIVRNATTDDDAHGWVAAGDHGPAQARLLVALALTRSDDVGWAQGVFDRY